MSDFLFSPAILPSANQQIEFGGNVTLSIKREDLLHPDISGNKFRKLKYNLQQARADGHETLLTFGGAFSNHIAAVAAAGKAFGFRTIGVIRGEEIGKNAELNPTLKKAESNGMTLHFISREDYRKKHDQEFIDKLINRFGPLLVLPEGGTNSLAVQGCEEILLEPDFEFDYICCAVGTGGTIAGIINSSKPSQTILGFPALADLKLESSVQNWTARKNWMLVRGYEFGGYGKVDEKLVTFINEFNRCHKILLDPVYTGKMLFGVMDLVAGGFFEPGSKILAIHTGGLQGIEGMNTVLSKKGLPIIYL